MQAEFEGETLSRNNPRTPPNGRISFYQQNPLSLAGKLCTGGEPTKPAPNDYDRAAVNVV
jgi:hypothetical protein